jgi:hypothetical protein
MLTTNPPLSRARMTVFPSVSLAYCSARSAAVVSVRTVVTSSISAITGTGLKKCIPRTDSGRRVAAPSRVMGIDDVLDARIDPFGMASSSSRKISSLSCSFSVTASIARSRSPNSARSVVKEIRSSVASRSAAVSLPRSTARSSERVIRSIDRSASSAFTSMTSTSVPPRAATSAIPAPI